MLALEDVKSYLGVTSDSDDVLLRSLMSVADEYLEGAIGTGYDHNAERAKMLSLLVISDLYDNQGITEKTSGTIRKLFQDFSLQLKVESGLVE